MGRNAVDKKAILIANEYNIVWLRWIFLIALMPSYVMLFNRNINTLFIGVVLFSFIYNIINHFTLLNKKYPKEWFGNNIYFDVLIITLLIMCDGGLSSCIFTCYYVFIIYEGIKREFKHPILLGLVTAAVYTVFVIRPPFEFINTWIILFRDMFILLSAVFVSEVYNQITFYDKQHKKEYDFARKDRLTGLLNKNALDEMQSEELLPTYKEDKNICLLLIDIDNMGMFNESFGFATGDDLVRYISTTINESIDMDSKVFRYGGDEFLVLLYDTDLNQAYRIAEVIRRKVSSSGIYVKKEGSKSKVTISCGVSCCPEHGKNIYELIEYANKSLTEAKVEGKNKVVISERED